MSSAGQQSQGQNAENDYDNAVGNSIVSNAQGSNPTPQQPGNPTLNNNKAVPGPGNAGALPNVPQGQAPNVNGGSAQFSDVTQGILDLAHANAAYLSSSADALKANTAVDQAASKGISGLTDNTLTALHNIQKSQALPGGATGDIAQILGIFNSDYDADYQQTQIKMNEVKSSQISNTAAAIKEQNNQLPQLMKTSADMQKVIFDAQQQANELALKGKQYDLDVYKTKIDTARLRLEATAEQRNQADFMVKSMSTAKLEAYLKANPNGPVAGLVESRLTDEKTALANLDIAQQKAAQGDREGYNNAMIDFVTHLPTQATAAIMADAQKKGSPVVAFPSGQPGKTIDIPYNLVEQGLIKNQALDQQVNQTIAAEQSQKLNIIPNMTNIANGAAALASMDPRATQLLTNVGNIMRSMNPKDPMSVQQTGTVLAGYKEQLVQIAKENAAVFTTPDAKGAVEKFGSTGKFDAQGGAAVMADSGGVPALMKSGKYSAMWGLYSQAIAKTLVQKHLVNAATPGNATDAASILAQMAAQGNKGKQKISEIGAEILANPDQSKPLQDAVKANIQSNSIDAVIGQLASQKGADPIWTTMAGNRESYENTNGQIDISKFFDMLEKGTITSTVNGHPNDMTQMFLRSLRTYAANADEVGSSDPRYTVQDRAAEAALFGGNANSSVIGDLHFTLRALATKARQTMKDRINSDVTGKTQRDAVMRADPLFEPQPGLGFNDALAIKKHTGVDLNLVPSATGLGFTAAQIKQAYPNGAQ